MRLNTHRFTNSLHVGSVQSIFPLRYKQISELAAFSHIVFSLFLLLLFAKCNSSSSGTILDVICTRPKKRVRERTKRQQRRRLSESKREEFHREITLINGYQAS
jgi:hypothetical protein